MAVPPQVRAILKHKVHWHVLLVHFPVSLFFVAFGFQILHLFFAPACFELATNFTLAAGAIMMIPTTWSGWRSWKQNYRGARVMIFNRKIATAFAMLGLSVTLAAWRFAYLGVFSEAHVNPQHAIYIGANGLLAVGAIVEGYYGGRLNHH